jgi:hypothetical protein
MKLKGKRNVTMELDTSPIQRHAEETSASHAPSHEEIRRRAYEIYLERDGLQGDELDDWLRAERELQKVALSNEAGIVFRAELLRFQMLPCDACAFVTVRRDGPRTPLHSETFSPGRHFSCVLQNGHATANTALPRWHLDLRNSLSVPHRNTNQ